MRLEKDLGSHKGVCGQARAPNEALEQIAMRYHEAIFDARNSVWLDLALLG
jgi:hypothetical protein